MARPKKNNNEIISNNDLPNEPIIEASVENAPAPKIGFHRREILQIGEPNATASYKRIEVLQL